MANIKNLRMCYTISADDRIIVKKPFFSLRPIVIYKPTGSIVDAHVIELSPADGNRLRWQILCASPGDLARTIGDFCPKPIVNGNYLAEICSSRDGAFLAIQLLQFFTLKYEPVTDVHIFEGDDAQAVKKMFNIHK